MRPSRRDDASGSVPLPFPLPRRPEREAAGEPPLPSEAELHLYEGVLAALGKERGEAAARFAKVRAAQVTVVGEGVLLDEVVRAGLRSGWRRVGVTGYPAAEEQELRRAAGEARRDPAQRVAFRRTSSLGVLCRESDLVVQLPEAAAEGARSGAAAVCGARGTALCQVVARRGEVWVGPAGAVDSCAVALHERLGAQDSGREVPVLAGRLAAVVAEQVAGECLRYLAGRVRPDVAWWARSTAVRVDAAESTWSRHVVPAVRERSGTETWCLARSAVSRARRELEGWLSSAPLPAGGLRERAGALVDPCTGVLAGVEEAVSAGGRHVYRAAGREPSAPSTVAVARTRAAAWESAVLDALAGYAAQAQLREWRGAEGPLWGWDLSASRPRALPPGPLVPPHPSQPARAHPPAGVAGGRSVGEALDAALHSLAEQVVWTVLAGGSELFPRVGLGDGGSRGVLWRALRAYGGELAVHELTDVLGLATYAVTLDGRAVAVRCAGGAARALTGALELALAARASGRRVVRGPRLAAARTVEPPEDEKEAGPNPAHRAVRALVASGLAPVALPLGGDPAVAAATPHLVRVLLLPRGGPLPADGTSVHGS